MKKLIVIVTALVLALGITGLGFSADKTTLAANHGNSAVCDVPNCCVTQVKGKEAVSTKKSQGTSQWSLTYWEALQRNGLDLPSDK